MSHRNQLFIMKVVFAVLFTAGIVFSQTTLSGSLGTMTLDSSGSPYTLSGTIVVGSGKTLTIGPGCLLLFREFAGIEVGGELIVQGTAQRPVVFTSVNDGAWNPASVRPPEAFDWNGIRIVAGGRALMSRFLISYSVYGLQSHSSDVMVSEGVFSQNGQFNFSLSGTILAVQENLPFTYQSPAPPEAVTTRRGVPRFAAPVGTGLACLGFTAGAVYQFRRKKNIHDEYLATQVVSRMEHLLVREERARNRAVACAITGGVLVPVTVGLAFRAFRPETPIAVSPVLGDRVAGVSIRGRF